MENKYNYKLIDGNFSIEDAKTTDEWIDLLKPPKVIPKKNPEP